MKQVLRTTIAIVIIIAVWWIVALCVGQSFIVPTPPQVCVRLAQLVVTGAFWLSVVATLGRVVLGFVLGYIIGVLLATLMHVSKVANWLLGPLIKIIRTTPVVSFILIILLWVASSFLPVVIAMLMVVPVVWANIYEALEAVDLQLLQMARVYRLGFGTRVRHIYVPACKSSALAAAVTGAGLAWKSGVTAEVLALPLSAIGRELYNAKIYLASEDIFVWTIVVIVLSALLEWLVRRLAARIGAHKHVPVAPCGELAAPAPLQRRASDERAAVSPIVFERVSRAYGDKRVVSDLDATLSTQGVVCLMGPSGSGKSTLLRLAMGLEDPSSGAVKNAPLKQSTRVSCVFEDDVLLPWENALDNVALVVGGDAARAAAALELVGLGAELTTPLDELSGGMRRRVAIARALAYDGEILVLDEPTLRLDAELADSLMGELCARWKGRLILLITHDEAIAARFATEIHRLP